MKTILVALLLVLLVGCKTEGFAILDTSQKIENSLRVFYVEDGTPLIQGIYAAYKPYDSQGRVLDYDGKVLVAMYEVIDNSCKWDMPIEDWTFQSNPELWDTSREVYRTDLRYVSHKPAEFSQQYCFMIILEDMSAFMNTAYIH